MLIGEASCQWRNALTRVCEWRHASRSITCMYWYLLYSGCRCRRSVCRGSHSGRRSCWHGRSGGDIGALLDQRDIGTYRYSFIRFHQDFCQTTGNRRGEFGGNFIRNDFGQGLVLLDHIPLLLEPGPNRPLGNRFSQPWHFDWRWHTFTPLLLARRTTPAFLSFASLEIDGNLTQVGIDRPVGLPSCHRDSGAHSTGEDDLPLTQAHTKLRQFIDQPRSRYCRMSKHGC